MAPYRMGPEEKAAIEQLLSGVRSVEDNLADEFEALLGLYPDSPAVLGHAAWNQARRGNHTRALELYDRILSVCPHMVEARWRRGDRLVNLGRLDDALAAYRDAQAADPGCEDALMGIRYVLYLQRSGGAAAAQPVAVTPPPLSHTQRANETLNKNEYAEGRLRLKSLPHALQLESTTKCNFACLTCSKGYDPYYAEDLASPVLAVVRRDLMPVNTHLSITGFGEPTLAGNFDEILDMGLRNGSRVQFVTNLALLDFRRLERLTSHPVEVIISIDGATPETFDTIRAGGSFALTLEKLAMIRKLRDIRLSHFVSHFSFHFVALRRNVHELPDVVRLAHRYGIEHVGVLDYIDNGNEFDRESLRHDPALAARWYAEARRVATQLGVPLRLPPGHEPRPVGDGQTPRRTWRLFSAPGRIPAKCWSPWSEPYIDTSGTVRPCCMSSHALGHLSRAPFASIWNGWRYRLLRWRIHSPLPPVYCRACSHPFGINAGNASAAMAREGLLVKAWYFLEWRAIGWARRFASLIRRPSPPPAPNYFRGKPLKPGAPKTRP